MGNGRQENTQPLWNFLRPWSILLLQSLEPGIPLSPAKRQKNIYFSWEHKSLCHLPKFHSYKIRPDIDFIFSSVSGRVFAFCSFGRSVYLLTLYFTFSLLSLFNKNMKQKRAFLKIFADNINRAIFNFSFCKYSASFPQGGKQNHSFILENKVML